MIFIKKKKPLINPKADKKFNSLVQKYGKPEYDSREGEACINGYGVAVFPSGEQFVIDAKTGNIIARTKDVRYIGNSRGLHFYIHQDHELLMGDSAKPSFPRKDRTWI